MNRAGLIRVAQKMADFFVSYSKQYLYCFPIDQPLAYKPELPPGLRMELISEANVDKIVAWEGWRMARRYRRFLNRGDFGFYVFNGDGEVVYCHWCTIRKDAQTLSCVHDPIEVGDAYLTHGHAREDFRSKGICTYVVAKNVEFLQERYRCQGVKRIRSSMAIQNISCWKLFERLGFVRCQEFHSWRLLGHCFVRWTRDLLPGEGDGEKQGRLSIKFKVPEIWWDPVFDRVRQR